MYIYTWLDNFLLCLSKGNISVLEECWSITIVLALQKAELRFFLRSRDKKS